MNIQIIEGEVTTDCSCEVYDEDTDTATPSEYCYGDCFSENKEDVTENIIKPWVEAQGWEMDTAIRIKGSKMTWRGLSGYADTTPENIIERLGIDGEYILRFKFDGTDLVVVRSSHDELGASFEFELLPEDEGEVE